MNKLKIISLSSLVLILVLVRLVIPVDAAVVPVLNISANNNITDSSSNNINTNWSGASAYDSDGYLNQALSFSGSNTVSVDDHPALTGMNELTISFWAKKNDIAGNGYVLRKTGSYYMRIGNAYAQFDLTTSDGNKRIVFWQVQNNDLAWHHYTAEYDGSEMRLYVDDVLLASGPMTGSVANNSSEQLSITGTNLSMDEIQIYNSIVDVEAPSIVGSFSGSPVSSSEIDLTWTAASDNTGVNEYRVYRNGSLAGTVSGLSFRDSSLGSNTLYNYTVRAYDGYGNAGSLSGEITVKTYSQTNTAPILGGVSDRNVDEGSNLSFVVSATDNENDDLTFSAVNLPSMATFDAQAGQFSWQINYVQAGVYSVTFEVSDGRLKAQRTIQITVNDVVQTTDLVIKPGTEVRVGEAVYFDASHYLSGNTDKYFTWDFGDGYVFDLDNNNKDNGASFLHYFMKPGVYKVEFKVVGVDRISVVESDSVYITVTGEAPVPGFEFLMAPFHSRIGQYISVRVPENQGVSRLRVVLAGDNGYSNVFIDKTNPDSEETFLLINKDLDQANYLLTAEVFDVNGERISILEEKYNKDFNGSPRVGIDENNFFVIDGGEKVFPITPWGISKSSLPLWEKYINTGYGEGWYPSHDKTTWDDFLNAHASRNMYAIGPIAWSGFNKSEPRLSDVTDMYDYISYNKSNPGLFGWSWDDEPSLGGREDRNPPQVFAAWNYLSNILDSDHPVIAQHYGFPYLPHYNPNDFTSRYAYWASADLYGGKKHFAYDAVSADAYPLEYADHISYTNGSRGPIDLWIEGIDNLGDSHYDLIPTMVFIETQDVTAGERLLTSLETWDVGPSPEQVRMEIWSSIIHGARGIGYFQYFVDTPPESFGVLSEVMDVFDNISDVVLSPDANRSVVDSANSRGNRVDTMVKETDTDIYIFANRVSEPDFEWVETAEPETINVSFDISGNISGNVVYDDFGLYKREYEFYDTNSSQIEYDIVLPNAPIKPGSVMVGYVAKKPSTIPNTLTDSRTGKVYDSALYGMGNLIYGLDSGDGEIDYVYSWEGITGTINYQTGEIHVKTYEPVPGGVDHLKISYAPENVSSRALTLNNSGTFSDSFEREEVKIYRIPKNIVNDNQAPTVPGSLIAQAVSDTQINLSWQQSTDNLGISGYEIYRNNIKIATTDRVSYSDKSLIASTNYSYTVLAYDANNNKSSKSNQSSVSTLNESVNVVPGKTTNTSGGSSSSGSSGSSGSGSQSSGSTAGEQAVVENTIEQKNEREEAVDMEEKKEEKKTVEQENQNQNDKIKSLIGRSSQIVNEVSLDESRNVRSQKQRVSLSSATLKIYEKIIKEAEKIGAVIQDFKYNLAYFIHHGTPTTVVLGAGERGGVIDSFRSAFNRTPETETDWQDVIKIANGRWPQQRNEVRENNIKKEVFKKIYLRNPDMNNPNDNAAVTVITYGLRPAQRNMDSEKAGIKTFRHIFKHDPATAEEWDIVRAIAYSGATR